MSKRRTRQEKVKSNLRRNMSDGITVSWDPSLSELKSKGSVNRQINPSGTKFSKETSNSKNGVFSATSLDLGSIKKNITKSLVFSALILGIELVLYFSLN